MSLKPPKKSDLNKGWMQPRLDRRKMIQPEYHLIVTEGTENAKKLEVINDGKQPSDSCPGTMVHYLVEKLRPYLI